MNIYNTKLQTNNTDLQEILDAVNALPEASGGSGEAAEYSKAEDAMVTGTLMEYTNDRVTTLAYNAFAYNLNINFVNFPKCTIISGQTGAGAFTCGAFYCCSELTSVSFPVCTTIGRNAFYSCSKLTSVSFPACTTIGNQAFRYCSKLISVSFPVCTSISSYAFGECSSLTSVSFPACTTIGNYAFLHCSSLTTANFPACTAIDHNAFLYCSRLISLYLIASSVCTLANSNVFTSTPIGGYSAIAGTYGTIYVPTSLLTAYQTATNWTYFSSRFSAIETDEINPPEPT